MNYLQWTREAARVYRRLTGLSLERNVGPQQLQDYYDSRYNPELFVRHYLEKMNLKEKST